MRDGFFHADMHQGNLFVDKAGRIVAIDLALWAARPQGAPLPAEILYGFITRDYRRVAEVHFEAGYVPRSLGRGVLPGAARHREPLHSINAADISMARLLTLLFE